MLLFRGFCLFAEECCRGKKKKTNPSIQRLRIHEKDVYKELQSHPSSDEQQSWN